MSPEVKDIEKEVVGKGTVRFVRVAPRKARLLADLIRGKTVGEALQILKFSNKPSACVIMEQLVKNALNSVDRRKYRDTDSLMIRKITVDGAPMLKRWRPRAMGRATRIRKRSSHINIMLAE